MAVSVTRAIAHDWDEERRRERALRRRMQEMLKS
jgi:glycine betaine transporter